MIDDAFVMFSIDVSFTYTEVQGFIRKRRSIKVHVHSGQRMFFRILG